MAFSAVGGDDPYKWINTSPVAAPTTPTGAPGQAQNPYLRDISNLPKSRTSSKEGGIAADPAYSGGIRAGSSHDTGRLAPGANWGGVAGKAPNASAPPGPAPHGTESGNTYIEDRYLNRLYGQDPAFNYAQKRGMESIANASSAAGNFNSGATRQQESDFNANLIAQSQAQLDAMAAGATGARQAKQNSIYQAGLGLAGGQAGAGGAYDLKSADTGNKFLDAIIQMYIGKAGVDSKSSQQGIGNAIGIGSLFA